MRTKRTTKRLLALLLTFVFAMAMSVSVFAASGTNDDNGTITIDNAIIGQTYNIYQIATLESYNTVSGAYSYKPTAQWSAWLSTQTDYVAINDAGYMTWVENANQADFAKNALAYAKTLAEGGSVQIAPTDTDIAESATVTFLNLNLGWYLVDSSAGALCSLDTTDNSVTIKEKNEVPTVDKNAVNDTDTSSPSIGDTVNFQITIHAKPGAENYVLHDTMGDGLALDTESIKVYVRSVADENELVSTNNYSITTSGLTDDCDFEIEFLNTYLNSISTNTDIIVTYNATITEDAIIGNDEVTNKAHLDYGDNSYTEEETTSTPVYSFDLVKTDSNDKVLDGAQFALYDAATGGNLIPLVKLADGSYRVASSDEREADEFSSAVIETDNGVAKIDGLGTGTYYLEEINAPDGYNKLTSRQAVTIGTTDNSATVNDGTYTSGGVQVINRAGSILPSTGGMGTTTLYILGAALVIGAGVVLVVRRRMSA